ncbi:MAG: anti-sigma factor [Alphaproteobacteria bacterium]|nr:anti-sigma factor [Alphaproteobacteria bacterium]
MPTHHVSEDLLLAYAAGTCSEAEALLVATHLTLCPTCRERAMEYESLGGALLDEMPVETVGDDLLESVFARLDDPAPREADRPDSRSRRESASVAPRAERPDGILLPRPLQTYLDADLDGLPWASLKRGIDQYPLAVSGGPARAKLLRLRSGVAVPAHTHAGTELTLVLAGGFSDDRGHFVRGDVAFADEDVDHRPVADEGEDCLCLTVLDAPLRLTGTFGRLLNPFLRF